MLTSSTSVDLPGFHQHRIYFFEVIKVDEDKLVGESQRVSAQETTGDNNNNNAQLRTSELLAALMSSAGTEGSATSGMFSVDEMQTLVIFFHGNTTRVFNFLLVKAIRFCETRMAPQRGIFLTKVHL